MFKEDFEKEDEHDDNEGCEFLDDIDIDFRSVNDDKNDITDYKKKKLNQSKKTMKVTFNH